MSQNELYLQNIQCFLKFLDGRHGVFIESLLHSLEVPPVTISMNLGNSPYFGASGGLLHFGFLVGDPLGSVLEDIHLPGLTGLLGTAKSGVVVQYMPHNTNVLLLESAATSMHTGKIGLFENF